MKKIITEAKKDVPETTPEEVKPKTPAPDITDIEGSEDLEQLASPGERDIGIQTFEGTNLIQYSYFTIQYALVDAYETKQPLMIYGDPGIGKSEIIKSFCKKIADEKNKEFLNWTALTTEQREGIIKDPKKYFLFIDIRANELDRTDIAGIPDVFANREWLTTKQPGWIHALSNPDSDGVLFLDEFNHAPEDVLKSMFQVILDKAAYERTFSKNIGIVAAGNLGDEYADALPKALTSRFTAGVLVANPDDWENWALKNGVDRNIIAYVHYNPKENFYVKPKGEHDVFPNPRAHIKLSKRIEAIKARYLQYKQQNITPPTDIYDWVQHASIEICGATWGMGFGAFIKHIRSFQWAELYKNRNQITKTADQGGFPIDKRWSLLVYLTRRLKRLTSDPKLANPKMKKEFEEFMEIFNSFTGEWFMNFVKWVKNDDEKTLNTFLRMAIEGTYNQKIKDEFMNEKLPKIKKYTTMG